MRPALVSLPRRVPLPSSSADPLLGSRSRAPYRLGLRLAALFGAAVAVVLVLPFAQPLILDWATPHLSSDGVVTLAGAQKLTLGCALVSTALATAAWILWRLSREPPGALSRLFADEGGDPRAPCLRTLWVATAVAVVTLASGFALRRRLWFIGEDGLLESLQIVALAAAAVLAAATARRLARRRPWLARWHGLLAVGAVLVGCEEVSWGQRLFGWQTPASWAARNAQEEINVHNVFNPIFGTFYTLLAISCLVLALSAVIARHRSPTGLHCWFLPQSPLSPLALAVPATSVLFAAVADGRPFSEMQEMLLAALAVGFAAANWRRAAGDPGSAVQSQ